MKGIRIFLTVLALAAITQLCRADDSNSLAKQNTELKQRVDKLEKEVEELKKLIMQQTQVQAPKTTQPAIAPAAPVAAAKPAEPNAAAPKLSDTDIQKILAMLEKEPPKKKPIWSDLDIQLYGYIKGDASYDSSRIDPGNYAKWVERENVHKDEGRFTMTANQTRLGLRINGPDDENIKSSGRIETDFYGNASAENKPALLLRHAYLNLDWTKDRFSILAGQTSDVISPLWPDTLNYTVGWWTGNIGYRRPQIRLTKSYEVSKDVDLQLEGAIARTIGTTNSFTSGDAGENSGLPSVQGRTSVTFPGLGYKSTTIGLSGHMAKEKIDVNSITDSDQEKNSWSVNVDLTQPINPWLTIKGEAYNGKNLKAYLGGIDQGLTNIGTATKPRYKEVADQGGWVAATLGPWDKVRFNIGTGVDDVDNDDVNIGDRILNRSIFGNVIYAINKNAEVGLELSQWQTKYKGSGDADSFRAQTALIYKF